MSDHVHLCLSIPPKYRRGQHGRVSEGQIWAIPNPSTEYLRSAFSMFSLRARPQAVQSIVNSRNFTGFHFWARGYCVSTVGLDEAVILDYIRNQEEEEKHQEQQNLRGL